MWSYSFEIPILMILGIVLLFYFSRPRIMNRRNRVFLAMIVVETLTIVLDVVACAFDNDFTHFHPRVVACVTSLYFIAFFVRAFVMYLFASAVVKNLPDKNPIIKQLIRIPLYVGIFLFRNLPLCYLLCKFGRISCRKTLSLALCGRLFLCRYGARDSLCILEEA